MMLQEALLRGAVKFEYDDTLGSDVGVAIVDSQAKEVIDLRSEWLPRHIYGQEDYARRIIEISQRRYYSRDAEDKAGILRYTKVVDDLLDMADIPAPRTERELTWLLSFFWNVDQAYNSLPELASHLGEGRRPDDANLRTLQGMYESGLTLGLDLSQVSRDTLSTLAITAEG